MKDKKKSTKKVLSREENEGLLNVILVGIHKMKQKLLEVNNDIIGYIMVCVSAITTRLCLPPKLGP